MIRLFTSPTQAIGEKGEDIAAKFLKKQGFSILERNVSNKFGEIDIVAKKKGRVHLFEVKAARLGASIAPAENLTRAKLKKFLISAEYYALTHTLDDYLTAGILVEIPTNPKDSPKVEIIEIF